LQITQIVERISFFSLISCRSGNTAMHSMTSASGRQDAARRTMPICSTTLAIPNLRCTGSSAPSGRMKRAAVPVVFAITRSPPPRIAPAQSRVMELLPRMPFTTIRWGIERRRRWCPRCSRIPATSRSKQPATYTPNRNVTCAPPCAHAVA
jgi:hypothetical protein